MNLFIMYKDMRTGVTICSRYCPIVPRCGEEVVIEFSGTYIVKTVRYVIGDGVDLKIKVVVELDRKY